MRVHSVGVCGTDIHYWKSGYCVTEDHPFCRGVIGHESSGVVSKLGEGVTGLQIGNVSYTQTDKGKSDTLLVEL